MDKLTMTEQLMAAKAAKGVTWDAAGQALGMSPVWLASACLGMNSAPAEKAAAIAAYFDQDEEVVAALAAYPTKIWEQASTHRSVDLSSL